MEKCASCNEIIDGEETIEGGYKHGETYCEPCFDALTFPADHAAAETEEREAV